MNIGIIGLPQTGKKTIFELLAGPGTAHGRGEGRKTVPGVAEVQDPRFDRIVSIYSPKKMSRARMDLLLPPTIEAHAVTEGDIFRDLAEVEVFCHVVRAFANDAVYHVSGSVDPERDIAFVNTEFVLHDLIFIEKRLERLDKDLIKKKDEAGKREKELLLRLKEPLEKEQPLRKVHIRPEEEKIIKSYPLLSRRKMIVVLNVSESDVGDHALLEELNERFSSSGITMVQVAAEMEMEIAALDTEEERDEFMREMGIEDTALHLLTAKCVEALGLLTFFTAAHNEVRQWFLPRGAHAVDAAAQVHTDLARGFIRAEVIPYAVLDELGSEEAVKAAGKLSVKGRDYTVNDGDTLFIRFNV
jgi:GTP-binding protein YchF